MELALSMERFRFILSNQSVWSEMYKEQKEENRKIYNKEMSEKKYYGNSKEYKKLWYKNGAQINK